MERVAPGVASSVALSMKRAAERASHQASVEFFSQFPQIFLAIKKLLFIFRRHEKAASHFAGIRIAPRLVPVANHF